MNALKSTVSSVHVSEIDVIVVTSVQGPELDVETCISNAQAVALELLLLEKTKV